MIFLRTKIMRRVNYLALHRQIELEMCDSTKSCGKHISEAFDFCRHWSDDEQKFHLRPVFPLLSSCSVQPLTLQPNNQWSNTDHRPISTAAARPILFFPAPQECRRQRWPFLFLNSLNDHERQVFVIIVQFEKTSREKLR